MLVLRILEKIKEAILKFPQESITVLKKMENYEEARVKLTNTQLKKSNLQEKNNTGTTLRINMMKNCHMNYF